MPAAPPSPRRTGLGLRAAVVTLGSLLVAVVTISIAGLWDAESPASEATPASNRRAVDAAVAPKPKLSQIAIVNRPTALLARPGGRKLGRIGRQTEFKSRRVLAVTGRQGPWLRVLAAELDNGRQGWVAADDVTVTGIDWRIRVDLSDRQIQIVKAGRVVRRMRSAVGEQGTPTPTGRFAVTDKVPFADPGSAYGCCALALTAHQPNTPSEWTGGDRIAIHATPATSSIGRSVTLGCMRIPAADARWLMKRLPLGTQVTIRA